MRTVELCKMCNIIARDQFVHCSVCDESFCSQCAPTHLIRALEPSPTPALCQECLNNLQTKF